MGVVKTIFGSPTRSGKGANELNFPWSLCYNGSLLYVGDKYNLRIVVFSPDDPATARVLTDAWPWASRFAPRGFASNTDGTLFMTSSFGGMIWKYDPPGSMEVLFGQSGGEDGAEFKVVLPQKIAGSGLRSYRDGRAEFAEFMFPAGIAVDLNGSLLVADHGNHILRRLRTLREAEVKAKLRKMLEDMNNRGIRMCYQLWAMNVTVHEPLEPLEVVMLLTLGTLSSEVSTQDSTSRQDSPLVAFHPSAPPAPTDAPQHDEGHGGVRGHTNESQALRVIVEALASCLEWRVVKTRQEVAHVHYADDHPAAITEEVALSSSVRNTSPLAPFHASSCKQDIKQSPLAPPHMATLQDTCHYLATRATISDTCRYLAHLMYLAPLPPPMPLHISPSTPPAPPKSHADTWCGRLCRSWQSGWQKHARSSKSSTWMAVVLLMRAS